MSAEDAAALASMKSERPPSNPEQPKEAATSEALGPVLMETSQKKPIDAHTCPADVVAMASMAGEERPHEAPQSAAMAGMMTAKQPVQAEAPFVCPTLIETSHTRRLDTESGLWSTIL